MAVYRIEAALDPATGKYRAKLFYPSDSEKPVATTAAIYDSDGEAVRRIEEMFSGLLNPPTKAPARGNSG